MSGVWAPAAKVARVKVRKRKVVLIVSPDEVLVYEMIVTKIVYRRRIGKHCRRGMNLLADYEPGRVT